MKQSELFKLTCQCLLLDEHPELKEGIKEKFISGEVDLDRFVYLCSNHLILPVIYLRFKNAGLMDVFPNEYANHLKEIYEANKKRNREILLQIDEISNQLEKENIEPLYLKGTANLMDNLYLDVGERMIGDIDFLVKEKDYLKTAELIFKLGYKNDVTVYNDIKTEKHYPRLYRTDVPADIEIHRIPVRKAYTKQFHTELLYQNKKAIKQSVNPLLNSSRNEINHLKNISGRTTKNRNPKPVGTKWKSRPVGATCNTFVSSNEHKLIHTFTHSQLSNKGYQFKQIVLRDLYDFYLLSKKVNTTEVIATIEEKEKAEVFCNYTKHLMSTGNNDNIDNNDNPLSSTNKKTKNFIAKHRYFLNHPRWHRQYISLLKLYELIIIRYLFRILKALFQKSSFKYLYARLKDPHWYKQHFKGLQDSFK